MGQGLGRWPTCGAEGWAPRRRILEREGEPSEQGVGGVGRSWSGAGLGGGGARVVSASESLF